MKSLCVLFISMISAAAVASESERCFSYLAEYDSMKSALPATFQKNPLFFVCQNCVSKNSYVLRIQKDGIATESYSMGAPDNAPVAKMCLEDGNVRIYRGRSALKAEPEGEKGFVIRNRFIGDSHYVLVDEATAKRYNRGDGFFAPPGFGGTR